MGAGKLQVSMENAAPYTPRRKAIMAVFTLVFLIMVYAVIPFDEMGLPLPVLGWWFPELSALFVVGAILVGIIDRMGEEELAECFVSGCSRGCEVLSVNQCDLEVFRQGM